MKIILLRIIYCCTVVFQTSALAQRPQSLECEYQASPINIDKQIPFLGWKTASKKVGGFQTAYQIVVSSSKAQLEKNTGDIWDSGKVISSESFQIAFQGKLLKSSTRYYWKVRIWNNEDRRSLWSQASFWEMGLLQQGDWKAKWITASQWSVPKEFSPKGLEMPSKGGFADVDLGKEYQIDEVRIICEDEHSFPKKMSLELSNTLLFEKPKILVEYPLNKNYNLRSGTLSYKTKDAIARFIRLKIPADTSRKADFLIRQLIVISGGKNVALKKFTREQGTNWSRGHAVFMVDGMPSVFDNKKGKSCPITAAPILRKTFILKEKPVSAKIYYAALGMAEVQINGKAVSGDKLGPPFSDYAKRIIYVAEDISRQLRIGENIVGTILANGYFSPPSRGFGKRHGGQGMPQVMVQLELTFKNGKKQTIVSDKDWKWEVSKIQMNDLWIGYAENRNLESVGWGKRGFDDSQWSNVAVSEGMSGKLTAEITPKVKRISRTYPDSLSGNEFFFKTLTAGLPQLQLTGHKNQHVTIKSFGTDQIKLPDFDYILAKDGKTILSPDFTISAGSTSMVVQGLSEPLKLKQLSIIQFNAALKSTSGFECSNNYLNDLYQMTKKTYQRYAFHFPADPSREKQGWTQDAQNMFSAGAYLFDVRTFYKNWWQDMADNQDEQGYLGSVVPLVNRQVYDWNSPWWSGALVYLPWFYYNRYGDSDFLMKAYQPMKSYVNFLQKMTLRGGGAIWNEYPYFSQNLNASAAREKMMIWNGAGDWQNPYTMTQFAVSAPQTAMPAFYLYARVVAKTASLMGDTKQDRFYNNMADTIKHRFNTKYFNATTGLYGTDSKNQTAIVLPLALGMVDTLNEKKVNLSLIKAIIAHDGHIGTGFVASSFLLHQLAKNRDSRIANELVNKQDYPSWNTLVRNGVLMENWKGKGVQMPSSGGQIGAWFIESVLGIQEDERSPGFKNFILSPQPDPATGLIWATGYYDSPYGRILSKWKYQKADFYFELIVPFNSTATVIIPANDYQSITESDEPVGKNPHIRLIQMKDKTAKLKVLSGRYRFISKKIKI
ncbi:alpha-L-rhamnosidase N-terminal domain-containing protein [Pedobacter sp. Leaf194]|uniref:alpha-L-rhamnosidase-related protein n=1 Tax=Pedobacter sp. Leaf194 TaxID=1736297 RepID=UPI00070325EC|nr:alpha-L-rhamnosidase N-terminal domain-containing protein [Pedobacter sp. Leaf194]KQS36772.1 hypothetical protein ASG14_06960 [Pedobacter sp. Leaf194]